MAADTAGALQAAGRCVLERAASALQWQAARETGAESGAESDAGSGSESDWSARRERSASGAEAASDSSSDCDCNTDDSVDASDIRVAPTVAAAAPSAGSGADAARDRSSGEYDCGGAGDADAGDNGAERQSEPPRSAEWSQACLELADAVDRCSNAAFVAMRSVLADYGIARLRPPFQRPSELKQRLLVGLRGPSALSALELRCTLQVLTEDDGCQGEHARRLAHHELGRVLQVQPHGRSQRALLRIALPTLPATLHACSRVHQSRSLRQPAPCLC
jgi:hypothetical protein